MKLSYFLCFVFIHCLYDYLECEYLLFYLHNKLSLITHQLTSGGPFDFVYCACILLWGHASAVAGGSQSTGIVEHGAVCIYIYIYIYTYIYIFIRFSERCFFLYSSYGLVLEIVTDREKDWNFFFGLFSIRLYNANLLTHQVHH